MGKIPEFFGDVFLFNSFLFNRDRKFLFRDKLLLKRAVFGPISPFMLTLIILSFFIYPVTAGVGCTFASCHDWFFFGRPIASFDSVLVISSSTDLISESSVTALLSHAAFFYLLCCVVFLIPVLLISW